MSEAAAFIGIQWRSLQEWADQGLIKHSRSPGGHRYFGKIDLLAFKAKLESDGAAATAALAEQNGEAA